MKTINRSNYEEFFLLYIDDELDVMSRLAVEDFIQQNADLAIELEMLTQAKSLPEKIVFADKDRLLRTEGNNINEINYEEYFLLYVDNELSASKREEVEKYVLQHPRLQDEFTLIKQTVLSPETLSYDNKVGLYRTEKRRAIYLKPWRLAAAAVFIGICITGWLIMQKDTPSITVAINNTKTPDRSQQAVKDPQVDTTKHNLKQPIEPATQEVLASKQPVEEVRKRHGAAVVTVKKPVESNKIEVNTEVNSKDGHDLAYQNTEPSNIDIIKQQNDLPSSVNTMADVPNDLSQKQTETEALPSQGSGSLNNGYNVYTVAYKEINTNDDDNSLHVGVFDLNKNKVKTLFKKAGRVFNNRPNDLANEDGKLQVANFEIQTKKQ
jgi:hypothetical protein